jgi:hypothetical protein
MADEPLLTKKNSDDYFEKGEESSPTNTSSSSLLCIPVNKEEEEELERISNASYNLATTGHDASEIYDISAHARSQKLKEVRRLLSLKINDEINFIVEKIKERAKNGHVIYEYTPSEWSTIFKEIAGDDVNKQNIALVYIGMSMEEMNYKALVDNDPERSSPPYLQISWGNSRYKERIKKAFIWVIVATMISFLILFFIVFTIVILFFLLTAL